MSWSQSYVSHCRVLQPGEFNGMSSQSHASHCMVLPLGEFTVMPHATLQGAVVWRNQCHDRATLQGVRIPSGILQIVFRHILFYWFYFNAAWVLMSGCFRIVSDTLVTIKITKRTKKLQDHFFRTCVQLSCLTGDVKGCSENQCLIWQSDPWNFLFDNSQRNHVLILLTP